MSDPSITDARTEWQHRRAEYDAAAHAVASALNPQYGQSRINRLIRQYRAAQRDLEKATAAYIEELTA